MKTISRTKAAEYISSANGKIFTVVFIKKDGTERTINGCCRKNAIDKLGYVNIYDFKKKGHRKVNTREITRISVRKQVYKVK